jgi:hypothetical protein
VSYLVQAVPLLVVALVVGLIVRDRLGRLPARTRRAPRARPLKAKRSHLSVVSRDRMDDELKDLLKRR